MMKREAERRKQRRREREACPVHAYERHGKEAQELRAGIERLMSKAEVTIDHGYAVNVVDLQELLDSVDARDSLAYLERCDGEAP